MAPFRAEAKSVLLASVGPTKLFFFSYYRKYWSTSLMLWHPTKSVLQCNNCFRMGVHGRLMPLYSYIIAYVRPSLGGILCSILPKYMLDRRFLQGQIDWHVCECIVSWLPFLIHCCKWMKNVETFYGGFIHYYHIKENAQSLDIIQMAVNCFHAIYLLCNFFFFFFSVSVFCSHKLWCKCWSFGDSAATGRDRFLHMWHPPTNRCSKCIQWYPGMVSWNG